MTFYGTGVRNAARALLAAGLLAGSLAGHAQQAPDTAELDCLVKPEIYVELSSAVDSVLEEVLVDIGDPVIRNQPVARLESSVERARLKGMSDFLTVPATHTFLMQNDEAMQQVLHFLRHGAFQRAADPP